MDENKTNRTARQEQPRRTTCFSRSLTSIIFQRHIASALTLSCYFRLNPWQKSANIHFLPNSHFWEIGYSSEKYQIHLTFTFYNPYSFLLNWLYKWYFNSQTILFDSSNTCVWNAKQYCLMTQTILFRPPKTCVLHFEYIISWN